MLWVEATQGDGVWSALESGKINLKLLEGCLSRSHSLNMACEPHDRVVPAALIRRAQAVSLLAGAARAAVASASASPI